MTAPDTRLRVRLPDGRRARVERMGWSATQCVVQIEGHEYYNVANIDDLEPIDDTTRKTIARGSA